MTAAGEPAPSTEARWVRCPSCGGEALYAPENPFRPFCTAVCKNIDFGAWASEEFKVETMPNSGDEPDG